MWCLLLAHIIDKTSHPLEHPLDSGFLENIPLETLWHSKYFGLYVNFPVFYRAFLFFCDCVQ